jgi:hypothetical protein
VFYNAHKPCFFDQNNVKAKTQTTFAPYICGDID